MVAKITVTSEYVATVIKTITGSKRRTLITSADISQAALFHRELFDIMPTPNHTLPGTFIVTHLRQADPDTFLRPLNDVARIVSVLAKTIAPNAARRLHRTHYPLSPLTKQSVCDPTIALPVLEAVASGSIIINDTGGYFAPILSLLKERLGPRLLGVVEDTRNGINKYAQLGELPCTVFSVASSPLKVAENIRIGQEIVDGAALVLQPLNKYAPGMNTLTIGQGPVGQSIVEGVRADGLHVTAYDSDISKIASYGTSNPVTLDAQLPLADIIFCATGNKALCAKHFPLLKKSAEVVLASSGDDELDIASLSQDYILKPVGQGGRVLCASKTSGQYFYLTNGVKSINFILPVSGLGPTILLVQAEIIRATRLLAAYPNAFPHTIQEISNKNRLAIAETYRKYF